MKVRVLAGLGASFILAAFMLPLHSQEVAVDQGWLTVRDVNLEISPGSPLDFSAMFPKQDLGIRGRVTIDADGHFVIGGEPERFLCAPMILTPPYGGFPDKATADRYATQLRRAGYNLVRIHHIESTLMTGRERDFDYDPVQLDRFHYFLSALRRQGIYWLLDAMTSDNGAYGGVKPHRWVNKFNLKVRVHTDSAAQAHWRRQVDTLLGRVNPYTGKSVLQDDALLGISLVNEGGLQFLTHVGKQIPLELRAPLTVWLKKRYQDPDAFERIWNQPRTRLDNDSLVLPPADERSERINDVLAFFLDTQAATARWMEEHLRSLGFRGLVTAYNNMPTSHAMRGRGIFAWVDMHGYHDEALGLTPGARLRNDSSFDRGLRYITDLATARLEQRAFTVSEYGHPFWNAWRRESALVAPSYAALHDWGAICQHASTAVDLTYAQPTSSWKQHVIPYAVGLDPVGRVVETLAALLYRRGDVQTAKSWVEIIMPGDKEEGNARHWGIPPQIARSALVMQTRTRLADMDKVPRQRAPAHLEVRDESMLAKKSDELARKAGLGAVVDNGSIDRLARHVNPGNRTNAGRGLFESVTGELLADLPARRFLVRTARTQAAVFDRLDEPIALGSLKVMAADRPALVAISALDGQSLERSHEMLLIVASDALNSDMRFSAGNRQELRAIGHLPVRIEPLKVSIEMPGESVAVSALKANGEVAESLPVKRSISGNRIDIDLASLRNGPSYYFMVKRGH